MEAGGWRRETGGGILEAGGWRREDGGGRLEAGYWMLDTGCWSECAPSLPLCDSLII
ncbi:MAG: phosphotransferase [Chitinophagaceae bacterium]|nr:phosphotransferase [Chitinophagaceae bacterium]